MMAFLRVTAEIRAKHKPPCYDLQSKSMGARMRSRMDAGRTRKKSAKYFIQFKKQKGPEAK
jgi:hypothetical protein